MSIRLTEFVAKHLDADLHRLMLSAGKYPEISMREAVSRIEGLRKIKNKVPDWYHPALQIPATLSVEQCSSAETASFKSSLFTGQRLADLTGGMGVDSFYWAKSFDAVQYVEQMPELATAAAANFDLLGANNIQVSCNTAVAFLDSDCGQFDLIYLDPARRGQSNQKLYLLHDCEPDVVRLLPKLMEHTGRVLVKLSPMLDITASLRSFGRASRVWVISVNSECKEILVLLEKDTGFSPELVPVEVVPLPRQNTGFHFTFAAEQEQSVPYTAPGKYLLEPDVAVMKSGAFKTFAARFGLQKLHTLTHLYTCAKLPEGPVPARIFEVKHVVKYDRKSVAEVIDSGKANISCRNFPDTPEAVRKRLKLADGGEVYLFATTLHDESKVILVCAKERVP